ncbi:MAG: glycoside hydrolase family 66 protein, partial [Oscillospiraceae bacterium]|nr:glycoside hydrolase family 66 protein [Oscillospiraceae bacterium]
MKKKKIIIAVCIILAAVIGGIGAVIKTENLIQKTNETYLKLKIIGTDKAMYSPKDSLKLKYKITNSSDKEIKNVKLTFKAAHLENTVEEKDITVQNLKANEERELEFEWQLPDKDFTGYLLEIGLANAGADCKVLDTIGADASSSWIKFPRYGYLCHFDADIDEQTQIEQMNRYHINAIEYYDWQYLHHQPIADGITRENPGTWKDWSGREISGKTIADYIKFAKEKNMVNMAYDMIYAGTDTFFADKNGNPTKACAWKLYFAKDNSRGKGNFTVHMGLSLSGNGNLFFVNPLNKEWQAHIFSEILKIFTVFDFDGWHGDTIGEW